MRFSNPIHGGQARILKDRNTKAVIVQVKPRGIPWRHASQYWEESQDKASNNLERGLFVCEVSK